MWGPLLNVVVCMLLCNATWGFFYMGMHRRGVDYVTGFLWTAGYFLFAAVFMSLIYWSRLVLVLQDFTAAPLLVLGIFMAGQGLLYVYFPKYIPEPKKYFERYPDRYYLKIDWRRLISKSMDILAQQVFIVLLVLFLQDAGLSFYQTLAVFGVLFALLHVPLIANERGAWPSWLFAGIVVVFSVVFPILILTVHYGFVYNYMLHWLFYTTVAVSFWLWSAHQQKRM